ncbi:putative c6 finger domain-containing protein [Erysiphe neolycopersici]|uniref:Putative c6 finger domain-containing protein n=1 Tax=Erysiphe neolycopersici TaxID=212602 RepID=A0A420HAI1_9PEZI|nr:putative c6 finger domain-containing protein [Erysiphe neolycopersici]
MQRHNLESSPPPSTHPYPTRSATTNMSAQILENKKELQSEPSHCGNTSSNNNLSPAETQAPKSVAFELLFPQSPQHRARIPMRVQIYPHDTTESIVTTVKNFYGLYSTPICMIGVSFEDEEGNTLIARYENFRNNMIVYVRVISESIPSTEIYGTPAYMSATTALQNPYFSDNTHQTLPLKSTQTSKYDQSLSKPISRDSHNRSASPNQGNMNSIQVKKTRSRSGLKGRGLVTQGSLPENHYNFYDGSLSSEGSSGYIVAKTKNEQIGSTEISLDNIVEGGRRKRAKFESSELPLFAPTQMPAVTSNSSVSPARRVGHQRLGIYPSNQGSYCNLQALQSPHCLQNGYGKSYIYSTPGAEGRNTYGEASNRLSINSNTPSCNSSGIIPTPDPTVGSCVSEEDKDVALQLMRLGELSNISQGRTSASTLDDTFSGKADTDVSTGATSEFESDNEFDLPSNHKIKREVSPALSSCVVDNDLPLSGDNIPSQDSTEPSYDDGEYEDKCDETFHSKAKNNFLNTFQRKTKLAKSKTKSTTTSKLRNNTPETKQKLSKTKTQRCSQNKTKKSTNDIKPISPTSLPSNSRKTSNASTLSCQQKIGEFEEDLSSKPRCQRCRKSKKGCDRQRPCQRCKDAGLTADQCISEDEGNGRKGRYGRHMGVPLKKDVLGTSNASRLPLQTSSENNPTSCKKRKR